MVDYFTAANRPLTQAVFSDATVWNTSVFESAQIGFLGNRGFFIRGTNDSETLTGTDGGDTIDGMDGADRISGGDGNDYLLGGAGGDQLLGGKGNDELDDGWGKDTLVFQSGDGQDIIRSVASNSLLDRNDIQMAVSYVEGVPGARLVFMASTATTLTRINDALVISVNGTIDGVTVEKYFTAAAASLYPIHSIQFLDMALDNAAINTRIQAVSDVPPVGGNVATNGNDVLTGTSSDDVIYRRDGNDFISGLAGSDFLKGELGNDQMFKGVGNNTVIIDSVGNYVWEGAGEGNDTVQSHIS